MGVEQRRTRPFCRQQGWRGVRRKPRALVCREGEGDRVHLRANGVEQCPGGGTRMSQRRIVHDTIGQDGAGFSPEHCGVRRLPRASQGGPARHAAFRRDAGRSW